MATLHMSRKIQLSASIVTGSHDAFDLQTLGELSSGPELDRVPSGKRDIAFIHD